MKAPTTTSRAGELIGRAAGIATVVAAFAVPAAVAVAAARGRIPEPSGTDAERHNV